MEYFKLLIQNKNYFKHLIQKYEKTLYEAKIYEAWTQGIDNIERIVKVSL